MYWESSERGFDEQLASLEPKQLAAYNSLHEKYTKDIAQRKASGKLVLEHSNYGILNFIRASPGKEKFNVESAWSVITKYAL